MPLVENLTGVAGPMNVVTNTLFEGALATHSITLVKTSTTVRKVAGMTRAQRRSGVFEITVSGPRVEHGMPKRETYQAAPVGALDSALQRVAV